MIHYIFAALRDQPVELHLDRTITQYTSAGPLKEPVVISSGDSAGPGQPPILTSRAGRVLRASVQEMIRKLAPADVTLYLDFEVINLLGERPRTALLDVAGRLERVEHEVATIRSRAIRGQGMRLHIGLDRVLFFHREEEPVAAEEWRPTEGDVAAGLLVLEVKLAHKGRAVYAYVPASEVLMVGKPTSITLA